MPNILLTHSCVRSCPYCFAETLTRHASGSEMMTWENLIYIVDFFEQGGDRSVALLGGEPLSHPEAVDFIAYITARGLHVTLFTSGITDEDTRRRLALLLSRLTTGQLTVVVNYNHPSLGTPAQQKAVESFLELAGPFVIPGVNIYKPDFDLQHVVDIVNRFGLQRNLRVGIAHPVPGGDNSHLSPEEIKAAMATLMSQLPLLEAAGITMLMDCGFPLCAFSDSLLGRLYRHTGGKSMAFVCAPSVDVDPQMNVWNCFPTAAYRKASLFDFDSPEQLTEWLSEFHRSVRIEHGGLYPECDDCDYRHRGLCSGGCLAHPLTQFINEPPTLRNETIRRQ